MPYHIGSIVCGEGRLGPAYPVRADVINCNGGRAAVLSSISIKAAVAGVMGVAKRTSTTQLYFSL